MSTRLPVLASFKPVRLSKGISFSLVFLFTLLALIAPELPDYKTYQEMYETGGGHLAVMGRDLGFVLLLQALEPAITYNQFRWLLIALTAILTLLTLRNLQATYPLRLGMSLVLALFPLIFIKFGVQIREGIALCMWIFIVLGSRQRPQPILFFLLAILSTSIHAATAALWLMLAIMYYLQPRLPRMSAFLASLVYASFVYIVADIARLEEDIFGGLSQESLSPDVFTVLYWLFYPSIFLLSLLQRETRIERRIFAPLQLRVLGFIVHTAMIGFLIGLLVQILVLNLNLLQKGLIADVMRVAALILAFYCIFLVIRGKNNKAILFALFLSADTLRIILAA